MGFEKLLRQVVGDFEYCCFGYWIFCLFSFLLSGF